MLPWAARQCPVPRALRAFARPSALRPKPRTVHGSAIIVPSRTARLEPHDLIQHIVPLAPRLVGPSQEHAPSVAVFFLTPALASWVHDGRFLQPALQRLFQNVQDKKESSLVGALVAVVDKLPTPRPIAYIDDIETDMHRRTPTPPVSDVGLEGLAYTLLAGDHVQPHLQPGTPGKGSIAIAFPRPGPAARGQLSTQSVRLPLANTVFQTGTPTTMFLSTFEKLRQPDSEGFRHVRTAEYNNVTLRLPSDKATHEHSALSVPLVPLTLPRVVEAAMGNILRRVTAPDGKSVPASEELENVVPQYFAVRGEPPQAMSVWALVMPQEALQAVSRRTDELFASVKEKKADVQSDVAVPPWADLWKAQPAEWNDLVALALSHGARLHRVLSGGGGWGKKAGLLSLDPSTDGTFPYAVQDYPGGSDEPMDLASALQQVVHEGDSIQFFASPSQQQEQTDTIKTVERLELLSRQSSPSMWELGTTPNTTDNQEVSSWQHNNLEPLKVFTFRNIFGALTEGDMVITHDVEVSEAKQLPAASFTKITVPFSRYCSVTVEDKQTRNKPTKQDSQRGGRLNNAPIDPHPPAVTPTTIDSLQLQGQKNHAIPSEKLSPSEDTTKRLRQLFTHDSSSVAEVCSYDIARELTTLKCSYLFSVAPLRIGTTDALIKDAHAALMEKQKKRTRYINKLAKAVRRSEAKTRRLQHAALRRIFRVATPAQTLPLLQSQPAAVEDALSIRALEEVWRRTLHVATPTQTLSLLELRMAAIKNTVRGHTLEATFLHAVQNERRIGLHVSAARNAFSRMMLRANSRFSRWLAKEEGRITRDISAARTAFSTTLVRVRVRHRLIKWLPRALSYSGSKIGKWRKDAVLSILHMNPRRAIPVLQLEVEALDHWLHKFAPRAKRATVVLPLEAEANRSAAKVYVLFKMLDQQFQTLDLVSKDGSGDKHIECEAHSGSGLVTAAPTATAASKPFSERWLATRAEIERHVRKADISFALAKRIRRMVGGQEPVVGLEEWFDVLERLDAKKMTVVAMESKEKRKARKEMLEVIEGWLYT